MSINDKINRKVLGNGLSRRELLAGAGLAGATTGIALLANNLTSEDVFIGRAADYSTGLRRILIDGFVESGITNTQIKGKSVLLKPNLVEPDRGSPHINTHPDFVWAVADAFLSIGAGSVTVAEGQGHCRDTYLVLEQSGLDQVLKDLDVPFVDLNHDEVHAVSNSLRLTSLKKLFLPQSLEHADLVVSVPKMKTHHWAGVTLSMKNMFGVMPGICYGWPKNVLHQEGIPQSILDINATVRPDFAIVDGIIGMEGDGPIMGTPKAMGVIVMGSSLTAVDATCARLMDFDPMNIEYLAAANQLVGTVREHRIRQRGESIVSSCKRFEILDHPLIQRFRPEA